MNDLFIEQIVKKQSTPIDVAKKTGLILGTIILIVIVNTISPGIGSFVTIGLAVGVYFLFQRLNLEYEYVFTNGELDIDKIFNRSNRKRALSINVREFELMAKVSDDAYSNQFNRVEQVLDFSSGVENDNTFIALFSHEGKKTKLIIEPNEYVLDGIKQYIPRNLKWTR